MTLGFPIFAATYRYYARKFRELLKKTPSAIILKLDFSNPKQAVIMNFPNANQRSNL